MAWHFGQAKWTRAPYLAAVWAELGCEGIMELLYAGRLAPTGQMDDGESPPLPIAGAVVECGEPPVAAGHTGSPGPQRTAYPLPGGGTLYISH